MKVLSLTMALALASPLAAAAVQRPPDTVFLEELTSDEVRALIAAGRTSVIIGTAGTEQNGPHMTMGKHRFIMEHTANRIARTLGNALVAPVITYVPEGSWENRRGHMAMPGTITLPEDRFIVLLEHAAKSLQKGGFTDIIFIGDSGGNQSGMLAVTEKLNTEWKSTGSRAHFIGDYYQKSIADTRTFLTAKLGVSEETIGSHAGISDTSQLMFVDRTQIRTDRLAPLGGSPDSGVSGDPSQATAELGGAIIQIKIDNALAQIRTSMAARRGDRP